MLVWYTDEMNTYQIFTNNETTGEIRPFVSSEFETPKQAIDVVRILRDQIGFPPGTVLLVQDVQGEMVYQNFIENGCTREWSRPGVMEWL